jgi:eukaryotic-like serine/threonine-protein kinase
MSLSANSRFGPYLVVSRLGGGGMGEVYKARDERLGRDVALKVLRPDTSGDIDPQRRFAQEARAASALNNPNILTVHDVGMEDGKPYIVTELVDGDSLEAILSASPLTLAKALDVAVQTASGLVAAHRAGIVHRDLKPANVMVTRSGLVKIVDFGLAKAAPGMGGLTGDSGLTHPGLVLGTASYMSPEQARGETVDFRSDHFSLGLILYEMFTGKRAFDRSSPISTLSAIIEDDFEPLATVKPSIPAPLRWCIERCLSKDRSLRYADTQDLYQELKTIRERMAEIGVPVAAAAVAPPKPRQRWKSAVLAVAVLAIAAATAGIASLSLIPEGSVDLNRYRFQPLATEGSFEGEPAWSADGKNLAYVGEVDSIRQIFVQRIGSPNAAQITRSSVDCDAPFWSPDGTRIYYLSPAQVGWSLWAVGASGGSPQQVQEEVAGAALSPDGKTLALLRSNPLKGEPLSLWVSVNASAPQRYATGPFSSNGYRHGYLRFSPDGRELGVWLSRWNGSSEFWTMSLTSTEAKLAFTLLQEASAFHWMADGTHIVFGGRMPGSTGADLHIADVANHRILPLLKTSLEALDPAPSPDGRRIAFTSAQNDFDLFELSLDGSAPRSFLSGSRSESYPSWAPNGVQYAFVTDRAGPPQIWIKSRAGGWERPLVTETDFPKAWVAAFDAVTYSPDGQRLAYTVTGGNGHTLYVSNVMGGPPLRLAAEETDQRSPAWSPDGAWVTYVENAGGKWSLAKVRSGGGDTPTRIKSLPGPCDPHWSPKGDSISCMLPEGLSLFAPDGSTTRPLSKQNWLAHGWNKDGSVIFGIIQLANRHRALAIVDVVRSTERIVAELPISAATAVQGFSLSPEGDRFLTAFGRPRADIWVIEGFERPSLFQSVLALLHR